jgi:shikimate kinase|tara:strand:- start:53 stop:553 length:501 start_codon:yes stop_codon:yes gene_type:complete
MSYYIIIRGPAGVGKTAIAKRLAKILDAYYISYDNIMRENELDIVEGDGISSKNFIKANNIILPVIKQKEVAIIDGCFYRKEQIDHLLSKLKKRVYIFTLTADIVECLKRNKKRKNPMTKRAIIEVYNLVSRLNKGIQIETSGRNTEEVIKVIKSRITQDGIKNID